MKLHPKIVHPFLLFYQLLCSLFVDLHGQLLVEKHALSSMARIQTHEANASRMSPVDTFMVHFVVTF
jgi:hypothetical protein